MHELTITRKIVEIALAHAEGFAVKSVVVEIGRLSGIFPDSVKFCFGLCVKGTPLADATLTIIEIPGIAVCQSCGESAEVNAPIATCRCGSSDLQWTRGTELKLKELEVI